jgi:hypothetical protein
MIDSGTPTARTGRPSRYAARYSPSGPPVGLMRFLLGFVCATVGAFPILSAFDVGPFHP